MFIYVLIGIFMLVEGIRAALPYKVRNNKTQVYCMFLYMSSLLTPLLFIVLVLNHIFKWDATIMAGKTKCFIILLAVLCICEALNIREVKKLKQNREELQDE